MAKCKKCRIENPNKNKIHYCDSCKKCEICLINNKSKPTAKCCKDCFKDIIMKSDEYREKMANSTKGKESWCKGLTKENNESLARMAEKKLGKESWNKGLTAETNESVKLYAEKAIGRKLTDDEKKKLSKSKLGKPGHKWTDDQKEKLRINLLKRIENGEIGETPKSKWYEYNGLKVQGRSEYKWIQENYTKVILQSKKAIKTPFGIYIPDFETNDCFVEIKSEWTYTKMFEKAENKINKMNWVNDNVKPITIYIDLGVDWAIRKLEQIDKV